MSVTSGTAQPHCRDVCDARCVVAHFIVDDDDGVIAGSMPLIHSFAPKTPEVCTPAHTVCSYIYY